MEGLAVGILEKWHGKTTFPEREPLTGLIIVNVLDAGKYLKQKRLGKAAENV
jgi:hypothetical protein